MKTTFPFYFFLTFITFTLFSFSDSYNIKRISDKDFRYEFYTTDKKIKPKQNKVYFWFKGGLIHKTQGGIAGNVLNDKFIKMYHNNQLAEQGEFKNGLRVGLWKTWYANGILATTQNWSKGFRSGKYFRYDENGNLIEKGEFSSDIKIGKWINTENKDTITYKKGIIVIEKQPLSNAEKYKLKQDLKKSEASKKVQKKLEEKKDIEKLADYKAIVKEEKKDAKEHSEKRKKAEALKKKEMREQSLSGEKKDSKRRTFFNSVFKKKDKTVQ